MCSWLLSCSQFWWIMTALHSSCAPIPVKWEGGREGWGGDRFRASQGLLHLDLSYSDKETLSKAEHPFQKAAFSCGCTCTLHQGLTKWPQRNSGSSWNKR